MKPLVSIIIPAYNAGQYIKEAVKSALAQTYKKIEIIVVDDGSTDSTKKVLESYIKTKKIIYIYQSNKGLSGARNTGMRAAIGNYTAFLDADDIFLPEKIERQADFLEKNPEYDFCYCDIFHFYEDEPEQMFKLNYRYYSGDAVLKNLFKKNFINPLSVVMRKNIIDKCGYFNESLKRTEDWDYWVSLAWQGARFYFLPEVLAKYRIRRSGSLSYDWGGEIQRKEIALDIFKRLKNKMTIEEKQKFQINLVILKHWFKLIYARLAVNFYLLRKLHSLIQSKRLLSIARENSSLSKLRLFLKLYPRLRYFIRYFRWQIKKLPIVGRMVINLEKKLVVSYAEERYFPDSPFSDGTDFVRRSQSILPLVYGRVLDLGCGYGYLTELMANKREVENILAIDKINDFRCFHSKIKYLSADISKLKKLEGKFNIIAAAEFIEHISEPDFQRLLFIVKKSLLPGGSFLGTTPDGIIQSYWPFHIREYSREELGFLLKRHFNKVEIKNIDFNNLFFKAETPKF